MPGALALTVPTLRFCAISFDLRGSRCKFPQKHKLKFARETLCGTQEPRKIVVSRDPHGYTVQHHLEFAGNAGALAGAHPRPNWLRVKFFGGERYQDVKHIMRTLDLHTVCESARCTNMGECWNTAPRHS